jgi:hypothetical protein
MPQDATIELLTAEAGRILHASEGARLRLRLLGSAAVQLRCPRYAGVAQHGRRFRDIDFAGSRKEAAEVREILSSLGYAEDREVFVLSEGGRAIFEHQNGLHIDVFYEVLDFCHTIRLNGRLDADPPTLPLAELLLTKLQIVQINEKDLLDAIVLLLEHELGETDAGLINSARIAKLCAEDWGLWRTTGMNIAKLASLAGNLSSITEADRRRVTDQTTRLLEAIKSHPKPLAWRLRAQIGDRVKWYKDVEEVR